MVDRTPFPRWAYAIAIEEIGKAPTLETLDQVVARTRDLGEDQGKLELAAAIRRRRVELAIAAGEAVSIRDHNRALERARADELRRVLEELGAMAAELDGEARVHRNHDRYLAANGKAEQAKLLRRAARRIGGR